MSWLGPWIRAKRKKRQEEYERWFFKDSDGRWKEKISIDPDTGFVKATPEWTAYRLRHHMQKMEGVQRDT